MLKNIFYAQSGGATAVINATACGVIEAARENKDKIGKVLAGRYGIVGALQEEIIDTSILSGTEVKALMYTPAAAFGSSRYKLKEFCSNRDQYYRLIEVFRAHHIGYFLYNGGGDSQDTANKVCQFSQELGYPIACIGIPKTIDNDLPFTSSSPGFGSAAKYVAVSVREVGLDVASMATTSTQVFIIEVMGRHTGWIAAASALARKLEGQAPHIILFPEIEFRQENFIQKVHDAVKKFGYCVVVVSEGLKYPDGKFLTASNSQDPFGHHQLGGVAPILASIVKKYAKYKCHWAVADYLQRSARHIASQVDIDQSYAVGRAAVDFAILGKTATMPIIKRNSNVPYEWSIGEVSLRSIANVEVEIPRHYISRDGFDITVACKEYLMPLIQGQAYPPYKCGLPDYMQFNHKILEKKLKSFSV